ncbi:glycosyltransferase [Falsiroseomonas sp. HW251]|uniref:glycosyltransferase n=1 Tax=Falsiroseomonas sp. HW251 TaxID=3390998 RepID=UPI003D310453
MDNNVGPPLPAPLEAPAVPVSGARLSIVIPVYWNESSLPSLENGLLWLKARLVERGMTLEVVAVNDGSGDGSLDGLLAIKSRRPWLKVVSLARNFGAVAASKTGLRYVTGDCFIIVAADLQDPLETVLEMVDHWRAGSRFTIAARTSRKDPASTRALAWLYYRIVDWLVVKGYPKGGFDLMLMDRLMLPHMAGSGRNTNPNMYAFWLGIPPVVVPYERRARTYGTSRWTFRKKLNFMIDTVSGFSVAPIRILSGFGTGVALLAFMYGINIVVQAALGNSEVQGFPTIVALIAFFSGIILVMLGVIGEYIWRIFDNVSGKPESVVERTWL